MNKSDYINKFLDLLIEDLTDSMVNKDFTPSSQREMNNLLKYLTMSYKFFSTLAKSLNCYKGLILKFHSLPKTHKANIPLRSIIDYRDSLLYKLSMFLAVIFKPVTAASPYSINSSFKFLDGLRNFIIQLCDDFFGYDFFVYIYQNKCSMPCCLEQVI